MGCHGLAVLPQQLKPLMSAGSQQHPKHSNLLVQATSIGLETRKASVQPAECYDASNSAHEQQQQSTVWQCSSSPPHGLAVMEMGLGHVYVCHGPSQFWQRQRGQCTDYHILWLLGAAGSHWAHRRGPMSLNFGYMYHFTAYKYRNNGYSGLSVYVGMLQAKPCGPGFPGLVGISTCAPLSQLTVLYSHGCNKMCTLLTYRTGHRRVSLPAA